MGMNLRRNFLTGLLVLVPAVVAGWVLYQAFRWVDTLLWERVRFSFIRKGGIPGVGIVIVVLVVLLTGYITNDYIGGRIVRRWDRLLLRIPLFNKIYSATKQVSEAFLSPERRAVFRSTGLVEFPRPGSFAVGFEVSPVTSGVYEAAAAVHPGVDLVGVFVPNTPNPTTGFLIVVPRHQYYVMPIPLEDGLKMVISGGVFMPPDRVPPAGGAGTIRDDGSGTGAAVEAGETRGA